MLHFLLFVGEDTGHLSQGGLGIFVVIAEMLKLSPNNSKFASFFRIFVLSYTESSA